MGMISNFLRVTSAELDAYLKDSSLLENKIYDDEAADEDPKLIDIGKSWDGILFLLTGHGLQDSDQHHPLTKALFSGQIIDEEQDLGYGPGQYLTAEQVKELNEQLSKISIEELGKRYDAQRMMALNIYPNAWEGEDDVDYLIADFKVLREIYAEASKNEEAIIMFVN